MINNTLNTFFINIWIIVLWFKYFIKWICNYRFFFKLSYFFLRMSREDWLRIYLQIWSNSYTHCIFIMIFFNFFLRFHKYNQLIFISMYSINVIYSSKMNLNIWIFGYLFLTYWTFLSSSTVSTLLILSYCGTWNNMTTL